MTTRIKSLPVFGAYLLHPRHWLNWLLLLLFFLFSLLPIALIDRVAELVAKIAYRKNAKRVHYAKVNLALCFPHKSQQEITELVKQHFSFQMKSVLHYGLIWWAPKFRLRRLISLQGMEAIEQHHGAGKQVIALTSHSVGLEFAVTALSLKFDCSGPYNSMKNKLFDWLVAHGRTRFGVRAYTRDAGFRPLIRDTRGGRVLIYLGDEDLGAERSVFAPFFGVQKATVPVLGRLAKQCNAVVLPCVSCYDAKQHKYIVKVLPEIEDLNAESDELAAAQMNKAIEDTVHECVAQYFWT